MEQLSETLCYTVGIFEALLYRRRWPDGLVCWAENASKTTIQALLSYSGVLLYKGVKLRARLSVGAFARRCMTPCEGIPCFTVRTETWSYRGCKRGGECRWRRGRQTAICGIIGILQSGVRGQPCVTSSHQ